MNYKALLVVLLLLTTLSFATTKTYAPAVDSNGIGVMTPISVTAEGGTGRIRTDIQGSLISTETEDSIRTAAIAASRESGANLEKVDINVDIDSEAQVIDGPSGGMAFGVAIYNELATLFNASKEKIRSDMAISGAITPDGRAEKVGGIEEKLIAANKNGIKLVIIAAGQSANDALDYAVFASEISNGELQVVEVHTLQEALRYAYTPTQSAVDAPEAIIKPLQLEKLEASEKTVHLKQIALEEIENALRELEKLSKKVSQNGEKEEANAVLRSVNETLKNAQEAVNKGYYYTGANAAFLAKINLQTVNSGEIQKEEFEKSLTQLENELKEFKTTQINENNFEQIAASQLRFWWASTRLQEVKEEFSKTKTISISVLRDYLNARAWFDAAKKLKQHGETISGKTVNEFNIREYALDLLEESEKIANTSTDTETQWHLKTAKKAIANANYVAAAFDLQFVTSGDEVAKKILQNGPDVLINEAEEMKKENIYASQQGSSVWAELYYANALFNLQEAQRANELSSIASAVRLKELALSFQQAKQTISLEFTNPRPLKNRENNETSVLPQLAEPQVSATITPDSNINPGSLQTIALVVIAIGLVILIVAFASKIKTTSKKNVEEIIDKLDEALVKGRITEETYKRLTKKYLQRTGTAKNTRKNLKRRGK